MTLTPYQAFTEEVVFILKLGLKIRRVLCTGKKDTHLNLKIHMQRLQATGGFIEALPDEDLSSEPTCLCFTEVGRQHRILPMLPHPLLINVLREEQGKKNPSEIKNENAPNQAFGSGAQRGLQAAA